MSIPDFKSIMQPFMVYLADGRDHSTQEIVDALGQTFRLTQDERSQLLPSGRQSLFQNRVAWARFYLKKAGIIESPRRGMYKLTDRGKSLYKASPDRIDVEVLQQFAEFRKFLQPGRPPA